MKTTTAYALDVTKLPSGRFVALIAELPEFIQHGDTMDELAQRTTLLVKRILEERGHKVHSVSMHPEPPAEPREVRVMPVVASVIAKYEAA